MDRNSGKEERIVVLGRRTVFKGHLNFDRTLRVQGRFEGTIRVAGTLIVDKDAVVDADRIEVGSLTVYGTVIGNVFAVDKVDMMGGAKVEGDVAAAKLRIADGVLFKGRCRMTGEDAEPEIFSRATGEIKAELARSTIPSPR
ncbi:MAG: polymer-forming cytoskeletal protein [Treponema sp.]|nr:polymer-forming cytoskeletal protein [Treponema sp.]